MTNYKIDLNIMQTSSIVIEVDGSEVNPLKNGNIWIAAGQRIDIMINAHIVNGSYPILAVAEGINARGQSGIVLVVGGASFNPTPGSVPLIGNVVGLMDSSLESSIRSFK